MNFVMNKLQINQIKVYNMKKKNKTVMQWRRTVIYMKALIVSTLTFKLCIIFISLNFARTSC